MKKISLILVFCFLLSGTVFAQDNMQSMRVLTINSLVEYGQMLYERGDFNAASSVFNHVLRIDHHQAQAIKFLKDMGQKPVITPDPVPEVKMVSIKEPIKPNIMEVVTETPVFKIVDISDTKGLKEAIEAKKKDIEELHAQIKQMRDYLASQSESEISN